MLRKLVGDENIFSNSNYMENALMAIKFTDKQYTAHAAENLKKIFSGLKLCIKREHYYQKPNYETQIQKIPNWMQDCKRENSFVFENHILPHQEGLATISANDNILVINSSHNVSDGGFLVSALSFCLSDMLHEKNNKNPLIYSLDAFKEEIEEAEKKFDPSNILPANKLTSCKYDTNDPYLAPQGSPFVYFDGVIPFRKISRYDKSTKKLRNLTEFNDITFSTQQN